MCASPYKYSTHPLKPESTTEFILQNLPAFKKMEAAYTSSSSTKTSYPSDPLHSVRKPMYKPWRKPVAAPPLPPNPTRVYKVKPIEFKDVVQKLTGAPEFQPSRLQTVAPAPLDLNLGGVVRILPGRVAESYRSPGASNGLGFDLSPSSNAWCSFLLSSPGNMSRLDHSTFL
ncbi:unnamed protein product [Rhodiola kirilowii]